MRSAYRFWIMLMALAWCALLAGCAASTQVARDHAQAYYVNGDYALAFDTLFPLAKRSDPDAQYTIAYMYYYGQGVLKDEDVARSWMRKSANLGNQRAKYALQVMLDPGVHGSYRNQYSTLTSADSDINWIRKQNPQQYTLVFEPTNNDQLKNVLLKQASNNRTVTFSFKKNGLSLQALAYGSYATSDAAEMTKAKLDKELQKALKLTQWQSIHDVMLP